MEKEFDDSLLSCFATDQNKTGNSSRTSISKHGKSTTNRAIRSTRSRSNSTDSDFNGDQKLVATVTASITNNPHSPIKKGKKGQSEGLVDTNPVVKDIAVKSGRNSKRKSSDDISVDSESSQTRKSLRLQSK